MPMYDENNTLVTVGVSSAVSKPDVIEIKNRTLDGQWHVQTIGTAATILEVSASFDAKEKLVFDNIVRNKTKTNIVFDNISYWGVISGGPSYARLKSMVGPYFSISFTVLVLKQEVV